ncbi:MAG TPA: cytochrome c [Candidatus Acidoferrales bacterium]|nr:cytochrome c [Candidatus Acidoferrales bacterium]
MMKPFLLAGLMVVVAVVTPLLLAAGGNADAGKAVYDKKCALCHGKEGEGKESIAKMMKVELPHLGSKEVQAKSDEDLKKIITEGKGKMKPVAGLSDTDKNNVIAFVRSLAKK